MRRSSEILVVVFCASLAAKSLAAGTRLDDTIPGILPGFPLPIAGDGDLSPMTASLMLSDSQAQAVLGRLQAYWGEWRVVQQQEFITFAPRQAAVASIWWHGPDEQTFIAYLGQRQRLESALQSLDESLWQSVSEVLAEDQSPLLQQEKWRRALEYLACDPVVESWLPPRDCLDVRRLLSRVGEEPSAETVPALDAYESALLRQMGELSEAVTKARRDWMKATEGQRPTAAIDTTSKTAVVEHVNLVHAWAESLQPCRELAREIHRRDFEAVIQIAGHLPADRAALLESVYSALLLGGPFENWLLTELTLSEAVRVCSDSPELSAVLASSKAAWTKAAPLRRRAFQSFLAKHVDAPPGIRAGLGPPPPLDHEAFDACERMRVDIDNMIFKQVPREAQRRIERRADQLQMRMLKQSLGPEYVAGWDVALPRARIADDADQKPIEFDEARWAASLCGENVEAADVINRDYQAAAATVLEASARAQERLKTSVKSDVATVRMSYNVRSDMLRSISELDERFCLSLDQAYSAPMTAAWIRLSRACERARMAELLAPEQSPGSLPDFRSIIESLPDPGERSAVTKSVADASPGLVALLDAYAEAVGKWSLADNIRLLMGATRPSDTTDAAAWAEINKQSDNAAEELSVARTVAVRARNRVQDHYRSLLSAVAASEPAPMRLSLEAMFLQQAFPEEFGGLSRQRAVLLRFIQSAETNVDQKRRAVDWLIEFDARFQAAFDEMGTFLWRMTTESEVPASAQQIITLQRAEIALEQDRLANELKRFMASFGQPD